MTSNKAQYNALERFPHKSDSIFHCNCTMTQISIPIFSPVPCVPNQIQANLSCASGVVDVSWQPSRGAFSYTAVAQGSGGFASSCNSTNTTCEFTNLLCGLTYSISVSASDDRCTSTQSQSVGLDTGRMTVHTIYRYYLEINVSCPFLSLHL